MIQTKHTMRMLALALALLMLFPLIVACKKSTDEPAETTAEVVQTQAPAVQSDEETTEYQIRYDDKGYEMDDLDIKGVTLEGKEVKILIGTKNEIYVEPDKLTTPLNSAIYSRHMSVEKRLDCKLNLIEEQSGWDYRASFVKRMQDLMTSDGVNLVACYSLTHSSMMVQGLLADLGKSENLDLSRVWWNQQMVDSCTIYDKIYFASGDISHNLIGQSVTMFFNKDLAISSNVASYLQENYEVDNLYDLVRSGEWTMDAFYNIAKLAIVDENGAKDEDDTFGYTTYGNSTDAFFHSCGMVSLQTGADGSLMISEDMGSQKADGVMTAFQEFLATPAAAPEGTSVGNLDANGGYMERLWKKGQVLFASMNMASAVTENTFGKGILPMPKYDTDQEKYYTTPNFGFQLWGVTRGTAFDYEDLCGVMECLASEGYRKVIPAYFETTLQGRQDVVDDFEMLGVVRDGIVIDGGRVLDNAFETNTWSIWRRCYMDGKQYASYYSGYAQSLSEQAASLNSMMQNMESLYEN
ncbi:MAG: hypothetical protein E7668_05780 [Ruminococcaceae bacterium]|nr:hypothetical protein [Oscillospiraceae bacterium]